MQLKGTGIPHRKPQALVTTLRQAGGFAAISRWLSASDANPTAYKPAVKPAPDTESSHAPLWTTDKTIQLHPKDAVAYMNHDRAIERDPRLALAYANRGWARLLLGDGLGAEKDFNNCFELDDALRGKFEPLITKQRRLLAEKQR